MVDGSTDIVSDGDVCKLKSTDVILPPFGAKKCSVMDGQENRVTFVRFRDQCDDFVSQFCVSREQ